MFGNPELVADIYTISGVVFLLALFGGTLRTLVRVVFYRLHDTPRPRLLTRDAVVYGGLSISFGLITVVRFFPPDVRSAMTQGNVLWALFTTVPACIAVLTYLYFEGIVDRRPWTAPDVTEPVEP